MHLYRNIIFGYFYVQVYHFNTMAKWLTDCLIEVTCVFIGAKTIEPGVIYSKVVGWFVVKTGLSEG